MPGLLPRSSAMLTAAAVATGLLSVVPAPAEAATPAQAPAPAATRWPGHPDRVLVRYVAQRGDTASRLAVRYHAWTAELVALNRLGPDAVLRQGQVLRIPVVVSAVREAGERVPRTSATRRFGRQPVLVHPTTLPKGWRHADRSRAEVRALVVRMARRYGVPPRLALAIAWQESGWQQRRVSSAGAIGVMQVMPDTGRWMRWYAGRALRLRDTHDNIWAGVLTLRTLMSWTKRDDNAIAAYYQGLGAVRKRGWYDDTRAYVKAVRGHELRIARGGSPLR